MQTVSDQVAARVTMDILNNGVLPSLQQVGDVDAGQVISGYFQGDPAGWSGNPLFVFLGDESFYRNTIIEAASDAYDFAALLSSSVTAMGAATDYAELMMKTLWMMGENGLGAIGTVSHALSVLKDTEAFVKSLYEIGTADLLTYTFSLGTTQQGDQIHGGSSADFINGGGGGDELYGDADIDIVDGGSGNDFVVGGDHSDQLLGGDGDDILVGGNASSRIDMSQLE